LIIIASQKPDGRLHVWVLDVGQGDAILVRTPGGHTALVDGGPGATPVLNAVGRYLPMWQRDLDLVVLTHPQQDHLMGLVELLARYQVGQVVQTEFTATVGVQAQWLKLLQEKGVPVHYARRGDSIRFAGEPDVWLRVLNPVSPSVKAAGRGGNLNDTSIVLQLVYGRHRFLLAGDVHAEAEERMALDFGADLRSDVLKVAHHGSATSSDPRFVRLVEPKVAIISVGLDNRFGHPAPETLQTLRYTGALVYRTDQNGSVELIADPQHLWVRAER
jgi:competence protein ComEC